MASMMVCDLLLVETLIKSPQKELLWLLVSLLLKISLSPGVRGWEGGTELPSPSRLSPASYMDSQRLSLYSLDQDETKPHPLLPHITPYDEAHRRGQLQGWCKI